MMFTKVVSLLALLTPSSAFTPNCNNCFVTLKTAGTNTITSKTQCGATTSDRRNFLENVASTAFGGAIMTVGGSAFTPLPAQAEVSQGNSLPEGAAQFKRLINLKNDIPLIITRVTENASEIDKKEWDNLGDFLRRLYKGSDDMKAFAKSSIYDPEKKKKAEEDVKLLQKLAQAGDAPVSKQDAAAYANILKKSDDVLENFFDLLRDVPDEL